MSLANGVSSIETRLLSMPEKHIERQVQNYNNVHYRTLIGKWPMHAHCKWDWCTALIACGLNTNIVSQLSKQSPVHLQSFGQKSMLIHRQCRRSGRCGKHRTTFCRWAQCCATFSSWLWLRTTHPTQSSQDNIVYGWSIKWPSESDLYDNGDSRLLGRHLGRFWSG